MKLILSLPAIAFLATVQAACAEVSKQPSTLGVLLSQNTLIKITAIKIIPTETGIEINLQSDQILPSPPSRSQGKISYIDIPNAALAEEFNQVNPAKGVAHISVSQITPTFVRVQITGTESAPNSQVTTNPKGLSIIFSSMAQAQDSDEVEITVTGQQQRGYRVPNAPSTTGTNTPILETPFSVRVIPQELIRDQQVTQIKDALNNISNVRSSVDGQGRSGSTFLIRGFNNAPVLTDGFRRFGTTGAGASQLTTEPAGLERIEVLKGPASILYGLIEPGGVINLISKRPTANPFYEVELQAGNRGLIRPRFDISGNLSDDGKVQYRLNGLYQNFSPTSESSQSDRKFFIAPTITWQISDRTDLNFSFDYVDNKRPAGYGVPAFGRGVANVPRDRIITDPSDAVSSQTIYTGYTLEHRFDDNWKLRHGFRYNSADFDLNVFLLPLAFNEATNTVTRFPTAQNGQTKDYTLLTNITGDFNTGDIKHTLLGGFDYVYRNSRIVSALDLTKPSLLNLANPVHNFVKPSLHSLPIAGGNTVNGNSYGFFLQDQISLLPNVKLLAGLRYDLLSQKVTNIAGSTTRSGETNVNANVFTPRVGLLYQIMDNFSLYGSYAESFTPNTATTSAGSVLDPQRGKGYEFGIKADLLDNKLLATLAYFDTSRTNVPVSDPANPLFFIATGEQRSRGFELDLSGEILPGWKVIASYANTNAEVTADSNPSNVGKKLFNAPENSANLWTTYEFPNGDLQGLGFGLGFNYVGDRQGDLANTYSLGSYFVTNAAIYYKQDKWTVALNFRNIGDLKYIESSAGGTRVSGNYFGDPFTIVGSVSVRF